MDSATNTPTLRKHVSAIHIGAIGFGLMHRKCVNACLLLAREWIKVEYAGDIEGFLEKTTGHEVNHQVSLQEFKSVINYNSNDNEHLKSVIMKLVTTPVEFNVLGNSASEDSWEVMSLLSHAKIENSVVSFRFPSEIRTQLISPSVYATISLDVQNQFDGEYALALYENTFRYHKIGNTPRIKLDSLKKLLGISKDSYVEFKYFNKDVIKKAIKEINRVSNIELTYETIKTGRSVTAIRFFVKSKQERDFFINENAQVDPPELQLRLVSLNLSESQIVKLFERYDFDYLDTKTRWILAKIDSDSSIQNIAAFAWSAIVDNYDVKVKAPQTKRSPEATEVKVESDENTKQLVARYSIKTQHKD